MKNQFGKFIAACFVICLAFMSASAQDAGKRKQMSPEQRVEMRAQKMKTSLDLTPEQTAKVKDLLTAQMTARKEDREARKDMHAKMQDEMGKILTPEQMTKYNEMTAKQTQRMQDLKKKK